MTTPLAFEAWMQQVDQVVGNIAFGLSVHDLPDFNSRDMYESGSTAQEAAEEALAGADFPFDELEFLG